MWLKKQIPLLVFVLGLIGVIACTAAAVIGWSAGARLIHTSQAAFERIDETLGTVRERVLGMQGRVQQSQLTTRDIEQRLRDLTRTKTGQELDHRLALVKKTETLSGILDQADSWLEFSTLSIHNVEQVFEWGHSLGAHIDPHTLEPLLENLTRLRNQLDQTTETVNEIHQRAAEFAAGEPHPERIEHAVQLSLRAVATLSEIDSRLAVFADHLSETQAMGQQLNSKTKTYLIAAQVGWILLFAWMAAGQVSLCRSGWRAFRQSRSSPNRIDVSGSMN